MLPYQLVSSFDALFQVELVKLGDHLRHEMTARLEEVRGPGVVTSGGVCMTMLSEGIKSMRLRADTALSLLLECMSHHGIALEAARRDEAMELLNARMLEQRAALTHVVLASEPFTSDLVGYGSQAVFSELQRQTELEVEWLGERIDSFVVAR